MRLAFLISLLLLMVAVASAATVIDPYRFAAAACATTDTSLPHDTFLYGFESGETGITESDASGDINLAFDSSALTTGEVDGICDVSMEFAGDNATSFIRNTTSFSLDANTAVNFVFYIYVTSALGTGDSWHCAHIGGSTSWGTSFAGRIRITESAGNIQVRGEGPASNSNYQNLTANSWNKVELSITADETGSSITVNDGTPQPFTAGALARDYTQLGGDPGSGETGTYVIDLIAVNTP